MNNKVIIVYSGSDLKQVLEDNNGFNYIYLGSNITLDSGIVINEEKENIIIDGTYNGTTYTLTGMNSILESDTISVNVSNKKIEIRNMKIIYTNIYGVVYVPLNKSYNQTIIIYNNVTFNGTQLSFNPYGTTQIIDSNITIEDTNSISAQEVCESNQVIIGGSTNITNKSLNNPLFYFRNDTSNPTIIFLCKSEIIISSDNEDFMNGTNKLNFTILHDTNINLVTSNGFAATSVCGANNVLIDERVHFTFIEKNHQRIPMWNIFGTFTMKKDSTLELINSYTKTPSDNYNIHFKGTKSKLILDNPKSLSIYTKNANVIYTNNPITFNIKTRRINMWTNSKELNSAGGINDLPEYSWYKDNELINIEGTITKDSTTITKHNFTEEELNKLPDLNNFSFQNKKEFSVGTSVINVHQINATKNTISGHTTSFADVLIKYNNKEEIVNADENGLFTYNDTINDNTDIEIISNISGSFIYETRKITSPYNGELSLLDITNQTEFSLTPISYNPIIIPRNKPLLIKIVDSRLNKTKWKIYAHIDEPLTSSLGYVLENALIFKKFSNEIITLNNTPTLVYEEENPTDGLILLNYSVEKGPLLDLTNDFLEINEEYFSDINFKLEE